VQRDKGRARAAAHFPACATPRKVWPTMEPWTIAAGRMTLKLERKAIEGAFAKEIAGLHAK
jgi:long-chain acyl-CoA synthetase